MADKDSEHLKMEYKGQLAFYNAERSIERALFNAVIAAGQSALKSAILINGGACVALLAFIGGTLDSLPDKTLLSWLLVSTFLLVLGTLFAAVASGLTYLSQKCYQKGDKSEKGDKVNNITITLVIFSYILFSIGCLMPITVFFIKMRC